MSRRGDLGRHRSRIQAWRANGVSLLEISRRLDRSHQALRVRVAVWSAGRKSGARPSDEELRRLYVDRDLSLDEIAAEIGRNPQTIRRWLREAGVKIRSTGPRLSRAIRGRDEELRRLYVDDELSTQEIADRLGCARTTVSRRLRALGVEIRPAGNQGTRPDVLKRLKSEATARALRGAPKRRRTPPDEELRRLYVDEQLSSPEIARRLNCSATAVRRALHAAGIEMRGFGLSGVRDEVIRRVADQVAASNRELAQARREERALEEHGAKARCTVCGRWVLQAPDAGDDGWDSAMTRLDSHLEYQHGLGELERRRALSHAEWRGGDYSQRRVSR